jgi:chemosensory pili system protein ChpA (sensor histidine kinase/response regulator)
MMSATQDYVALDWIKGEIAQTLEQAQFALEAVASSSEVSSNMRACLTAIHQVHGTLKMVQLEGPTNIAAEMEELAQGMMNKSLPDEVVGQETLMQAILQMPGYLDRIHREQRDSPEFVGLLVNELRIARGEAPRADNASGAAVNWFEQAVDIIDQTAFEADRGAAIVRKLRPHYQTALTSLLRKETPRDNLSLLGKVLSRLIKLSGDSGMSHLFQLGLAVVDGVSAGAIKFDSSLANKFKALDGEIKRLGEQGAAVLGQASAELGEALLAVVNKATKATPRMAAARIKFNQLEDLPAQLSSNTNFGPDDETLAAVAKILIEELTGITDKLDLYVRSSAKTKQDIVDLVPALKQIGSTLSVVGLDDHQQAIVQQLLMIEKISAQTEEAQEDQLIEMARAFLQIEASLRSMSGAPEDGGSDNFANLNDAESSVIRETRNGLAQSRDKVIEFVMSEFDQGKLYGLAPALRNLRGGLSMVNQQRSGDVLLACALYIEAELLGSRPVPELAMMDDLADALTSIDYYLERLLESSSDPYLQMVEVAETAVGKLGYPVAEVLVVESDVRAVKSTKIAVQNESAPQSEAVQEQEHESLLPPIADVVEQPVGLDEASLEAVVLDNPAVQAVSVEPAVDDDLIDDQILEIFIEEAEEVFETINEYFPQWRTDPQNVGALTELRRAFHTLKGSGRMVGAVVLGELAWSIESLLNRLIDGGVSVSPAIIDLINNVIDVLPSGIEAFKTGQQSSFEVSGLVEQADLLADNKVPEVVAVDNQATVNDANDISESEVPEEIAALDPAAFGQPSVEAELIGERVDSADAETLELETLELESLELETLELEGLELESIEVERLDFESLDAESDDLASMEEQSPVGIISDIEADEGVLGNAAALNIEDFDIEEIELPAWEDDTDSELLEIFVAEAEENLAVITAYLTKPAYITTDLIAAFHTLKGSAGMAGVTSIAEIAAPLEKLTQLTHGASMSPSPELNEFIQDAYALMSTVLVDLVQYSTVVPGGDFLVTRLQNLSSKEALKVLPPAFDFEKVSYLVAPFDEDNGWETADIENIVAELEASQEQAQTLNSGNLLELLAALLRLYRGLADKPTDEVLMAMGRGHETLLVMFDCIAASQEVMPAGDIIGELDGIDLHRLKRDVDVKLFAYDAQERLTEAGSALVEWQSDPSKAAPLEQLCQHLVTLGLAAESHGFDHACILLGVMQQLAERFVAGTLLPNEDDARLLEAARYMLIEQLDDTLQDIDADIDDGLLSQFRDRLATPETAMSTLMSASISAPEVTSVAGTEDAATDDGVLLPADQIDEEVLPLFLEEAEEILEAIDESIFVWSGNTASSAQQDNLLRHLHTLKGGARLAGLNSLGEFTHNFETYLSAVERNPVALNDEFFAMLNRHQDEIGRRVAVYQAFMVGETSGVAMDAMRQSDVAADPVSSTTSQSPESAAASPVIDEEIDEEILSIFIEEADELLEAIDACVYAWSENPAAKDQLDLMLRHLHTIKGGARLAGLSSLGEFAHNLESFLSGVHQRGEAFDEAFFALLNQQQDELHRRVEIYRKLTQGEASAGELASLIATVGIASAASGSATVTSIPAGVMSGDMASNATDEPVAAIDDQEAGRNSTQKSTQKSPQQASEMVRVSSELLEQLINLAGESSITRGRVQQQITDFGGAIEEMEATIERIRDQVRRLEIEAESRETVFRSQQANEGESAFDELEMDRYTMLQEISRSLSEGSSDMMDLKDTLLNKSRDAESLLHQQARISSELQEGLTRTHMVPFARLIPRLRRIVRQISGEVSKSVRFDAFNVEGELDRNVLERIVAPLEHMLRNAVDHGIESTEDRLLANKSETGRISLRLSREGGYVLLTISDDGGGINVEAVRSKAIERGLISATTEISDHEVMQFIMHAGFSTAAKLTQISGRGVGMDVVNSEIKQLGGSLAIDSTLGMGTQFTIRIPFTVSINRALMVVVKEETYAVPLNTIEGIVRVSPYELEAYYQPDAPMFEYAGQPYRLIYMGKMLERAENPSFEGQVSPLPVILARSGNNAFALQVDRVIGSREVVVKTLGRQFSEVDGVSGATVLGDGKVVIILDIMALVLNAENQTFDVIEHEQQELVARARKVMIVDDSVTVRKVTSRLMERQGWEVLTAKDGVDAVNQLQDVYPDMVLLDIEMPRMDGFEVLRTVRRDPRLASLPIIMITSRTGEKHQQQAKELGVNGFLGKPFQEAGLMSTIEEVLSEIENKANTGGGSHS